MTFASYEALGGLDGAIGRQADATWESLDNKEARKAFPRVLRALVDVARGRRYARRHAAPRSR